MDHIVLDCWEPRNKNLRFVDELWDNKRDLTLSPLNNRQFRLFGYSEKMGN